MDSIKAAPQTNLKGTSYNLLVLRICGKIMLHLNCKMEIDIL